MKDFLYKLFSTLMIAALVFYLGGVLIKQERELRIIENEKKQYQALLDEANMKTEELRQIKSRLNTDEYIEEYAREKLGLVMPYEIIFMDASI
ncbi:MAG: septum formation initiator family protein [Clostridia bacterium]|nr:septum formation initiator family protein [Clostridia bacterium]